MKERGGTRLKPAAVARGKLVKGLGVPSAGGSTSLGAGTAGSSSTAGFFGTSGTLKILVSFNFWVVEKYTEFIPPLVHI